MRFERKMSLFNAVLCGICFCVSLSLLIMLGYLSDGLRETVSLKGITVFCWLSTIVSAASSGAFIIVAVRNKMSGNMTLWSFVVSVLLVAAVSICAAVCVAKAKDHYAEAHNESDYMESAWFDGIGLDRLKTLLDGEGDGTIIYIGRKECSQCFELEKMLEPFLAENNVCIPCYYTDADRNGDRAKEMYDLLGRHGIDSVPQLIFVENGCIVARWSNFEAFFADSESYI